MLDSDRVQGGQNRSHGRDGLTSGCPPAPPPAPALAPYPIAFLWSGLDAVLKQGISLVAFLILARLLAPRDFGLIALTSLFVAVARSSGEAGLGSALIQAANITNTQRVTVLLLNVASAIFLSAVLWSVSPYVAKLFAEPELEAILRWLTISIVCHASTTVATADYSRDLNFRPITKVTLIASSLSALIGVCLAVKGFGVYSLVAMSNAEAAVTALLLNRRIAQYVRANVSIRDTRPLITFGIRLYCANVLSLVFDRLPYLAISKLYSATALGYFSRSLELQTAPTAILASIANKVAYPSLSKHQGQPPILKAKMAELQHSILFVTAFISVAVFILAEPLITSVLGPQWKPAADYLRPFALATALLPMHTLNLTALKAVGRSDELLKAETFKRVIWGMILVVSLPVGLIWVAWGYAFSSILSLMINSHYISKRIKYTLIEQLRDQATTIVCAILSSAAMLLLMRQFGVVSPTHIILIITIGLITYITTAVVIRHRFIGLMARYVAQ